MLPLPGFELICHWTLVRGYELEVLICWDYVGPDEGSPGCRVERPSGDTR